ncbi:hypothetical protein BGZ76_002323, partial [Entomortierella beljakovae]
ATFTNQTETTSTAWSSEEIEEFINQHWSADQFPLSPPNNAKSWESVNVYFKALDPETVQAIVPIGQIGIVTNDPLVIVIILLLEGGVGVGEKEGSLQNDLPCWKYHNMSILRESDILLQGWEILTDQALPVPSSHEFNSKHNDNPTISRDGLENSYHGNNDDVADDDDDDYWGQYGEEESESESDDENPDPSKKTKESDDPISDISHEQDDEESYWKKYAEQQEKQDEAEKKRKQQQQQQQQEQEQDLELQAPQHMDQPIDLKAILESLPSIGSSGSSTSTGDLDQTMLSSLLGMMTDEAPLLSTLGHEISNNQVIESRSLDKTPKDDFIVDSLRTVVLQATKAGYSKDRVFEILGNIYESME